MRANVRTSESTSVTLGPLGMIGVGVAYVMVVCPVLLVLAGVLMLWGVLTLPFLIWNTLFSSDRHSARRVIKNAQNGRW